MKKGLLFAYCLSLGSMLTVSKLSAQNPIIKDIGMSDPHVRVFNDKIYLYTGHDDHPDDKTWVMKEWRVFSSTDLTDWKQESTISPKDNYMGAGSTDCWAADAATRNGEYYFYFSDRNRSIGVMTSDSPTGPFTDALGEQLVERHDPTIFTDDDENQTNYIVYGDKRHSYRIARLNEDMISLAETPKNIQINGEEWDKAPAWMDKNYLFKHNGTYYLSWGGDYATSQNVYGPYTTQGSVGNGYKLGIFAHGSFFWWKGQFYHVWCYYLRQGYRYRESVISYCHFDNQGKIVTDTNFLDKHFATGVGQYDASWSEIEAEWYYEKSKGTLKKQECEEGGFQISNIQDGEWLRFNNINFPFTASKFTARVSGNTDSGSIQIRTDSPTGPILGELKVPDTGGNSTYTTVSTSIKEISGKKNLYITFSGDSGDLFNLNWFRFGRNTGSGSILQMIKRNATDYAIDGNEGGTDGQSIYLWNKEDHNVNQQWLEIDRGNGYYSYQKQGTNFCMDGGDGGAKGQDVFLGVCQSSNENQQWKKIRVESNFYRFEKRNAPGFSIDGGNGGANEQNLYLWTTIATNQNQQWQLNQVSPVLGQEQYDLAKELFVYPNPVTNKLQVFTKQGTNLNNRITIYTALGHKVRSYELSYIKKDIDVAGLRPGLFFIKFDQRKESIPFIKK